MTSRVNPCCDFDCAACSKLADELDTLRAGVVRAQKAFDDADDEYMRRLNDPDGYLPTHTGPGRLEWLQSVSRMERAADNLRAAKKALRKAGWIE